MNKTIYSILVAGGLGILLGQLSISQGMDVKIGDQPELEKSLPPIEQIEAESDQFLKGGPPKKPLVLVKRFKVYDENTVIKIDDEGNPYIGLSIKELKELEIPQTPATPIRDDEHGILFNLKDTQSPTQEPEKNTIEAIHDTQKRLDPPSPIITKSVSSGPLAYNEKDDQYSFKIKIKTVEPYTELPK